MAWNGCSWKMASQLWGEVPLALMFSRFTRISRATLCIRSACTVWGRLLAGQKSACSSWIFKLLCMIVVMMWADAQGVKDNFAHHADLIAGFGGFLNHIFQHRLIFIRRKVLDTSFKREKPSDLFLRCLYRMWICLWQRQCLCIQIYAFVLDPKPRQISNNMNHMNLPEAIDILF